MKCIFTILALFLACPLANAQYAQRSVDSAIALDSGKNSEVLNLLKNSKIINQQSQLVKLQKNTDPRTVKKLEFDLLSGISRYQPGLERVVPSPVTDNIKDKIAQDRIINDFCRDKNDSSCLIGVGLFANSLVNQVTPRSKACADVQAKIVKLAGFNGGNADLIENSDLDLVASYHKECTTSAIPPAMKNLLGLVVDVGKPCTDKQAGIIFPNGKRYQPIGMAVQISVNRIYTARHLLYEHISDNKFVDRRKSENLFFLPASSPTTPIRIIREIRPAEMSSDNARVPFDQTILEIVATPLKGIGSWPVVKKVDIVAGQSATPLYIAGFHLTLAKASFRLQNKDPYIAMADWPKFLRRDAADSCRRVTQNVNGCMLHACDTVGGLSGSPIFATIPNPDSQPMVIGMHTGAAYSGDNMICSAGMDGQDLNIGALPSPLLLQN